jgi:hypothetical protein
MSRALREALGAAGVLALEKRVPGAFSRRRRMPLAAVPTTVEARVVRLRLASRDACGHTVLVVLVRVLARPAGHRLSHAGLCRAGAALVSARGSLALVAAHRGPLVPRLARRG